MPRLKKKSYEMRLRESRLRAKQYKMKQKMEKTNKEVDLKEDNWPEEDDGESIAESVSASTNTAIMERKPSLRELQLERNRILKGIRRLCPEFKSSERWRNTEARKLRRQDPEYRQRERQQDALRKARRRVEAQKLCQQVMEETVKPEHFYHNETENDANVLNEEIEKFWVIRKEKVTSVKK